MYEFTEFDEIADQIASDNPPRDTISMEEAMRLARNWFLGQEAPPVVIGVALALWRSYRSGEGQ
jgi:hypothetical protein